MLKAVLLIFDPVNTWDKIEQTQRSAKVVFFQFFLPLLIVTSALEGYGLLRLGRERGLSLRPKPVPINVVLRYEAAQTGLSLFILLGGAWLLKRVAEGFHRKHSYAECFVTVAYSLSAVVLLRVFHAFPAVNGWLCWGVGIALSISALYRGIPRIMKPDPSNALGIYLMACLLFLFVTGLAHYLATLVLDEKILASGFQF